MRHRRCLAIALCTTSIACSSAPTVEPGIDPFVPGRTLFEDAVAVDPDAASGDGSRDETTPVDDATLLDTGAPRDAGSADVVHLDTRDSSTLFDTGSSFDTAVFDTAPPDTRTPVDTSVAFDTGVACSNPGDLAYGGHCYFRLATPQPFDDAQKTCTTRGAHLVTITSSGEQTFVQAMTVAPDTWIGLSRPASAPPVPSAYVWVTGEPVTFTKWQLGEPNGSGLAVRLTSTREWADTFGSSPYDAICERE